MIEVKKIWQLILRISAFIVAVINFFKVQKTHISFTDRL